MLNLARIYYKILFYIAALIPLIPNFGQFGSGYNLIRVVFTAVFFFMFLHVFYLPFTGIAKKIKNVLIGLIIFTIVAMLVVEIFDNRGIRMDIRDVFELYKPFYYFFLYTGWIGLIYKNYTLGNNINRMLLIGLTIVSAYNLLISWSMYYTSLPFSSTLNPYYTVDGDVLYSTLRSTGLPGQPGTASNYTAFLIATLLWLNTKFKNRFATIFILIAVVCNIMACLLTYSRIGLIVNIASLIYFIFSNKNRIIPYSIIFLIGFSILSKNFIKNEDFVSTDKLFRDIGDGDAQNIANNRSTDARFWARRSAELTALSSPTAVFFGVGPKKKLLNQTHLISYQVGIRSNQLWAPDSDYAVFVSRYGFLGMILNFLPLILLFIEGLRNFKKNQDYKYLTFLSGIALFIAQLDPPLNDLRNTHIIYLFVGYIMFYNYYINPRNLRTGRI